MSDPSGSKQKTKPVRPNAKPISARTDKGFMWVFFLCIVIALIIFVMLVMNDDKLKVPRPVQLPMTSDTAPAPTSPPEHDCVAMTPELCWKHFRQNPTAFVNPDSYNPGDTFIKCKKSQIRDNDNSTQDVSACMICIPK